MEGKLTDKKEAGFMTIHNAIDRMNRIASKLEELKHDIVEPSTPFSFDEIDKKEKIETPTISLHAVLEHGSLRIHTVVEDCVKCIDEIRELIL